MKEAMSAAARPAASMQTMKFPPRKWWPAMMPAMRAPVVTMAAWAMLATPS